MPGNLDTFPHLIQKTISPGRYYLHVTVEENETWRAMYQGSKSNSRQSYHAEL